MSGKISFNQNSYKPKRLAKSSSETFVIQTFQTGKRQSKKEELVLAKKILRVAKNKNVRTIGSLSLAAVLGLVLTKNIDITVFLNQEEIVGDTSLENAAIAYNVQEEEPLKYEEMESWQKLTYLLITDEITDEEKLACLRELEDIDVATKINYAHGLNLSYKDIIDFVLSFEELTDEEKLNYVLTEETGSKDDIIRTILGLEFLDISSKANYIWNVLEGYTLNVKINYILDLMGITYDDYLALYKVKNRDENQELIWQLFSYVNEEKVAWILEHYPYNNEKEFNDVVGGILAECGAEYYSECYRGANIFFNRITDPGYNREYGANPYSQFIAKNQFTVFKSGKYKKHSENCHCIGRQGAIDMFYSSYDGIVFAWKEFRSWDTTDFSDNYYMEGGNRYGVPMDESARIIIDSLIHNEDNTLDLEEPLIR